ncbi:MAG: hypothetical protein JNM09_09835, partial [Blastocatellia bacterium]|nr:hypothetical protein [Blastocatellia bacterium]
NLMANAIKAKFLEVLAERFGTPRKLNQSLSLYVIGEDTARIYIRYSKVHDGHRTFYGLRDEDLQQLEGHPSLICFLWDNQKEPLFIRFADYEEVFHSASPAGDGQYKVQIYPQDGATELYVARAGRFNVEGNFGWSELEQILSAKAAGEIPALTHSQVQTLLGAIGIAKGFDVWIPMYDRGRLDWSMSSPFLCQNSLPQGYQEVEKIIQEIDVIWMQRGSSELRALFEVEHSTPIYSGLLRFNDLHLVTPRLRPRFSVVANDARRELFVRQLNRPTFRLSGLNELCTFLDYRDVFGWHTRINR